MSLQLRLLLEEWRLISAMLGAVLLTKAFMVGLVARLSGSDLIGSVRRASMFLPGGEFAFVLFTAAVIAEVLTLRQSAIFGTVVVISMAVRPLMISFIGRLSGVRPSFEHVDPATALRGRILLIGFGRFGQIASQAPLSKGISVSVIDRNPEAIREASLYGFKVFYGDGTRLDILQNSGADEADVIMVCVDHRKSATEIVKIARAQFPNAKLLVRSRDRDHAMELLEVGVDFKIRETLVSAFEMGGRGLHAL